MSEYRPETEKLLFSLPLAGSAFRKVYWDPNMERPCSMFVPSEDLVVSYGASSLETCERITHVMKRNRNDVRKMQVSGFYADVELGNPTPDNSQIQEEYDDLTGDSPSYEFDGRYTLLEIHTDVDLEGFEDEKDGEPTGVASLTWSRSSWVLERCFRFGGIGKRGTKSIYAGTISSIMSTFLALGSTDSA